METQIENLGKVAVTVEKDYWNRNKVYDKLTIVEKQGIFGTYISRKTVPAGIDISNRDYWIPFSSLRENLLNDYNSFINKFNFLINSHDQSLNDLQKFINELAARVPDGIIFEADREFIYHGKTEEVTFHLKTASGSIAKFYVLVNGTLIKVTDVNGRGEADGTLKGYDVSFKLTLNPNDEIHVIATINNYNYDSYWHIGEVYPSYLAFAGNYNDVRGKEEYLCGEKNDISGKYTVECPDDGAKLYLLVPEKVGIESVLMNGFTMISVIRKTEFTYDGITYNVYESMYGYHKGVYSIEINQFVETEHGDIIEDVFNAISSIPTPNNEDIALDTNTNTYKFADKIAGDVDVSGMGVKWLRKNIKFAIYPFDGFVENKATFGSSTGADSNLKADAIYFDTVKNKFIAHVQVNYDPRTEIVAETVDGFSVAGGPPAVANIDYRDTWAGGRNVYYPLNPIMVFELRGTNERYRWNGVTLARYYGTVGTNYNALTQDLINESGTIYIIREDYDLLGQNISIPDHCVLYFAGGSISNGALTGDKTLLKGLVKFDNVELGGTFENFGDESSFPDNPYIGQMYFLKINRRYSNGTRKYIQKPYWWTGDVWVDAEGNEYDN